MLTYGALDMEMTCDGRHENGRFIDDGRMKHSQREIISVGFIVYDDKYKVKAEYSSFVKPVHNNKLTDYCEKLTGIVQSDVDSGKKCNNAFHDIKKICYRYSVNRIFTFGGADKFGISTSAKWNRKIKEKVNNLYIISSKIIDIRPAILNRINWTNRHKSPSLSAISEKLGIEINGGHHNSLNDAILLYKICRKLNMRLDKVSENSDVQHKEILI